MFFFNLLSFSNSFDDDESINSIACAANELHLIFRDEMRELRPNCGSMSNKNENVVRSNMDLAS